MPIILVVEKSGSIKENSVKDFNEDDLFKKAGFKTKDGFGPQIHWMHKINKTLFVITLYGKTKGRAGTENKYDFPPPTDSVLYFGSCVLVCHNDNSEVVDLSKVEWLKKYEKLFGGFEDIGSEDSEEEEEEEEEVDAARTKEGYVKDDFVVDEEEEEEEEEEEDDEETELNENDEETTTEEDIEDELDDEPEEEE